MSEPLDRPQPRLGLSWMDHPHFAATALPLLQGGEVELVEWSFDTAWRPSAQTAAVLDAFASQGRLLGHGVSFSVLSADDGPRQDPWLQRLEQETRRRAYDRVSEHLAFMTAGDRSDGAPLPLPASPALVRIGRDAVSRLSEAASAPIGLENLALALSPIEVHEEGALLEAILAPSDGFVVLDLHNLWCRAVNADLDPLALLRTYPLGRVREVHLSGGSWDRGLRRDTHDGSVPDEVFALLRQALPELPAVDAVILEQLPEALETESQRQAFIADFRRMRAEMAQAADLGSASPTPPLQLPTDGPDPASLQAALLDALEDLDDPAAVRRAVQGLAPEWTTRWDDTAVSVAAGLVKRWTRRP